MTRERMGRESEERAGARFLNAACLRSWTVNVAQTPIVKSCSMPGVTLAMNCMGGQQRLMSEEWAGTVTAKTRLQEYYEVLINPDRHFLVRVRLDFLPLVV